MILYQEQTTIARLVYHPEDGSIEFLPVTEEGKQILNDFKKNGAYFQDDYYLYKEAPVRFMAGIFQQYDNGGLTGATMEEDIDDDWNTILWDPTYHEAEEAHTGTYRKKETGNKFLNSMKK